MKMSIIQPQWIVSLAVGYIKWDPHSWPICKVRFIFYLNYLVNLPRGIHPSTYSFGVKVYMPQYIVTNPLVEALYLNLYS